ncbi:hypothetical protein Elgi_40170 [Paenibacillus elgii]|uniref:hypothetical protein n=1 Tax=Paenibacillus elgii TaxID=189691 RepID=UPI002D7BA999|nr:hypothetical protein Elgi_40170 [Paenibacillus elgii]
MMKSTGSPVRKPMPGLETLEPLYTQRRGSSNAARQLASAPAFVAQMQQRFGNQATIRYLSGSRHTYAHPPVQCKINMSPMIIRLDDDFTERIAEYNELAEAAPLSMKINMLSEIERACFHWFVHRQSDDLQEDPEAPQMRTLMDLLHMERQALVKQSVTEGNPTAEDSDLPIAGFEQLDEEAQRKAREIWGKLIQDSGSIRIVEKEGHGDFKLKMLTEFSRILESHFGRELMGRINESDKKIEISPFSVARDDGVTAAASPVGDNMEHAKLKKLSGQPRDKDKYKEIKLDGLAKQERISALNDMRREGPDQLGVVLILQGRPEQYYAFGEGTDVKVTMPSDVKESSFYYGNRLVDTAGKELIAPAFSTLTHELGHAFHMQQGTKTDNAGELMEWIDDQDNLDAWSNMEEYINIQGTENPFRSEYGLGERHGHLNIPYLISQRLQKQVGEWYGWLDGKTDLDRQSKEAIETEISELSKLIFADWTDEQKLMEAKQRMKHLPRLLEQMYAEALERQRLDRIASDEESMGIRRSAPIAIPGSDEREQDSFRPGGPVESNMDRYAEQFERQRQQYHMRAKYYNKLGI